MKGWMYILECADGSYYTGSTNNLELRLVQHQVGKGANHTKKRLPVKLIYFEEYQRIDEAFYREKQVQGWSRKKKEALINGIPDELKKLAECMNETHYKNYNAETERNRSSANGGFDFAQPPLKSAQPPLKSAQPPLKSAQPPLKPTQPPLKPAQPPSNKRCQGEGNTTESNKNINSISELI